MCDYSLHGIRNRLAQEGETLVVHRFFSGSKGLTSPEYLKPLARTKGLAAFLKRVFLPQKECAVCIPDGARLKFEDAAPDIQRIHGIRPDAAIVFRQLSAEAATYRDAVELPNGVRIRLQELDEGQRMQVLTIAATESITARDDAWGALQDVPRMRDFLR